MNGASENIPPIDASRIVANALTFESGHGEDHAHAPWMVMSSAKGGMKCLGCGDTVADTLDEWVGQWSPNTDHSDDT